MTNKPKNSLFDYMEAIQDKRHLDGIEVSLFYSFGRYKIWNFLDNHGHYREYKRKERIDSVY
jgi:hypothetical protein